MTDKDLIFEESLSDGWTDENLDIVEVPLDDRPLVYVGIAISLLVAIVAGRVLYLNVARAGLYADRADTNSGKYERQVAPRGLIVDRNGTVLAENVAVFSAYLNAGEYLRNKELQEPTIRAVEDILKIPRNDLMARITEWDAERAGESIVLAPDITQEQLVLVTSLGLPTLTTNSSFRRSYPDGEAFSSILGYVGLTTAKDLEADPSLNHQDLVGKIGIELRYDNELQGTPGLTVKLRDARGQVLETQERTAPQIGRTLRLTIDGEFQSYLAERMAAGLRSLGRTSGVGLAIDPRNGQILALLNFPLFDNNAFTESGRSAERTEYLVSGDKPLFNRAVMGEYSPGSTVKPLVGIAALKEGVVTPERTVFSPGYMDVANPYDPSRPSRFLDWQHQGPVNLYSAIAQSSDVYFYLVGGGGSPADITPREVFYDQGPVRGIGIEKLRTWWSTFGFGEPTGIDIFGERKGFLPSIGWKEEATGSPWRVGDTYNVSIGQGDLLVTPIQLIAQIASIAEDGLLYVPTLNLDSAPQVKADLTYLQPEIREAQKGMRLAVTSPRGTAHILDGLALPSAAKTGTAQINNNKAENSFFVGYGPYEDPQIAIMILVENARIGTLNAAPIARDVLDWYYTNRVQGTSEN